MNSLLVTLSMHDFLQVRLLSIFVNAQGHTIKKLLLSVCVCLFVFCMYVCVFCVHMYVCGRVIVWVFSSLHICVHISIYLSLSHSNSLSLAYCREEEFLGPSAIVWHINCELVHPARSHDSMMMMF